MHTQILKRCGYALIAVGVLDIVYMIWCIAHQISYSSSFNIFAVVGGILLVRGGLKTARWVAQLSTFMLVAFGGVLLVMPFMFPLGYWMAVFRHGSGEVMAFIMTAVLLALLIWLRREMMNPALLEAQKAAGLPPPKIKSAILAGIALPLFLLTFLGILFSGDAAHEALRRAEQQLGGGYKYVVTNMQIDSNMNGKNVSALVTAYNDSELKTIQVSWKE